MRKLYRDVGKGKIMKTPIEICIKKEYCEEMSFAIHDKKYGAMNGCCSDKKCKYKRGMKII